MELRYNAKRSGDPRLGMQIVDFVQDKTVNVLAF